MRGHVHKRTRDAKNGKATTLWYAIVDVPTMDGRRRQDWGRGFRTRKEADAELARKVTAIGGDHYVSRSTATVGDYLTEWLGQCSVRVKPTTHSGYEQVIRDYVRPHIGTRRLQDLRPVHLTNLYTMLLERGGRGQRKGRRGTPAPQPARKLSAKTVSNVHLVLSKALNDAVEDGLLATNPAAKARPASSRVRGREVRAWTAEELTEFLAFSSDDRYYAAWHLAASTGMRRGELLGLRWMDVENRAQVLAVRKTLVLVGSTPTPGTPKNHEARAINLDPDTLSVLRRHHKNQMKDRLAWGEGYIDSDLVFTREDGRYVHPDRLSQMFDRLVRKSGLRRITLHDLRHTHATLLLKEGVPVKVVSERLGHADPAFTMRTYQHVLPGMQADAAARFARILASKPSLRNESDLDG